MQTIEQLKASAHEAHAVAVSGANGARENSAGFSSTEGPAAALTKRVTCGSAVEARLQRVHSAFFAALPAAGGHAQPLEPGQPATGVREQKCCLAGCSGYQHRRRGWLRADPTAPMA